MALERPAEVRLRAGMVDRVLGKKLERIRRYVARGRPVLVRTLARRSERLDETTLLGHYERLAYTLRALRWSSRGPWLVRRSEAVLELDPERGGE